MRINSINATAIRQNFGAKTTITAPDSLICQKDKEYFENPGAKIGNSDDMLNIQVSDLYQNEKSPNVLCYDVSKTYSSVEKNGDETKINKTSNNITIPYIKDEEPIEGRSPLDYLKRIFKQYKVL